MDCAPKGGDLGLVQTHVDDGVIVVVLIADVVVTVCFQVTLFFYIIMIADFVSLFICFIVTKSLVSFTFLHACSPHYKLSKLL